MHFFLFSSEFVFPTILSFSSHSVVPLLLPPRLPWFTRSSVSSFLIHISLSSSPFTYSSKSLFCLFAIDTFRIFSSFPFLTMFVLVFANLTHSPDSCSLDIAMGYGLDDQGSISSRSKTYSSRARPIQFNWYMGVLSPKVKRQESEAEHSFPSNGEVKMVALHSHSLSRLHRVALKQLSTGTTLLSIFILHPLIYLLSYYYSFIIFLVHSS